jgi:oligopeptide/dipeptide ABC transporter ATP-binding protein
MSEILLSVKNLSKDFPIKAGFFNKEIGAVHAVNNVTFSINRGETLGLVGESGCGKTTAGRCILGLIKPTSGEVIFDGINLSTKDKKQQKNLRKRMQIVFQNPYSSLNPRMKIQEILTEPFIVHKEGSKESIKQRIKELADMTGLSTDSLRRYPHEFSGGQRQRIVIARALALNPAFIVADEPVSALDVSIQAQIINLLENLKKELGLTYLFISHDLSIVKYVSTKVAVMYLGEIIELGTCEELYKEPKHPYTQILLSSNPIANPKADTSGRIILKGDLPSPSNPPSGCKFHTRCPYVMEICKIEPPPSYEISETHNAKCYLLKETFIV